MFTPLRWNGLHKRFNSGKPFPHIVIKNALSASQDETLRRAIERAPKKRMDTDLYSFWQSDDLKKSKDRVIAAFARSWSSIETKDAIARICGVKVPGPVDMAGFAYRAGDYLLPHDDRMTGRKIAYILYLTTSRKGEGGTLDLYGSDSASHPLKVKKSIIPCAGSLVLFRVSTRSWHRVAEHLAERPRITIGGWFNG